jgi:hypothetical protein
MSFTRPPGPRRDFSVSLPVDMHVELKALSMQADITMRALVERAIRAELSRAPRSFMPTREPNPCPAP